VESKNNDSRHQRRATIMRFSFILIFLVIDPFVHADELNIPVPGQSWSIRLDAPKLVPGGGSKNSIFYGRADRLQLSFFVEPPRCPGGDSDENIYECFANSLQHDPIVEWDTERANTIQSGVLVMYMAKLEEDGKMGRSFNMHVLFAHQGKWADVHGSFASPSKEDVENLYAIMNSIKVQDGAREQ
jgi:hypothetical protein